MDAVCVYMEDENEYALIKLVLRFRSSQFCPICNCCSSPNVIQILIEISIITTAYLGGGVPGNIYKDFYLRHLK